MLKNAEESLQGTEEFPIVQATDAQALGVRCTGVCAQECAGSS